jgi:hypothetical protein
MGGQHLVVLLAAVRFAFPADQACFDASPNRKLAFEVWWQVPPPRSFNEAGYTYFPMTATASTKMEALNSTHAPIDEYFFLWANRREDGWNKKGNVVLPPLKNGEVQVRTFFSDLDHANRCTLAQAARVLGYGQNQVDRYGSGLRYVTRADDILKLEKDNRLENVCILEQEPLNPRGKGIVLDYEVRDDRSPEETLRFLKEFTVLVHGRNEMAVLLTNPWDAPTERHTGVAASNAHAIYEAFDRMLLFLWHNNRQKDLQQSAESQLGMMGDMNPKRIVALFELANTTMAEAEFTHGLIVSRGFSGVMFWRNYAKPGGDCGSETNRKIACVVFGRCQN